MTHAHASAPKHTNRLADETSPYLLQHAHNPVDWYPWGPEAFERARREDRPIFLSVGYSTCYWCHVMERQSFESEAVAAVMNELFVNVKVDREERPDVDQLYMTAVQLLTRRGGWPMSVWLTPDLRPFYGGTYYPPTDQYGRPGFVTLLHALADAYKNRRDEVEETANQLVNVLTRHAEPAAPERPLRVDDAFVDELTERSTLDYDPTFGGFGGAPKFPRETLIELLLVYLRDVPGVPPESHPKSKYVRMVRHTLDAMAAGGIRDHLGGGFHRYSTDARWLVPHFEIMLYDNAMLAWCYVEAFRQTGEPRYAAVARGVLDFVLREMSSPEGAFYTAIDAEVDGQEGLNYLWTKSEIEVVLGGGEDAKLFNRVYGVDGGPNFADPHHGSGVPDKNILFLPQPLEDVARTLDVTAAELDGRLEPLRQKLKAVRDWRKQPLLDTKVLTSWNAIMSRAFAHAARVLNAPRYLNAAGAAISFIRKQHRTEEHVLCRTSRDGVAKHAGFLDDYACLIQAMFELGGDGPELGSGLLREMIDRFGDLAGGGFYFTRRSSPDLLVRQKTAIDSPLPSGNAVAASVLVSLGQLDAARATLAAFARQMEHNGEAMSSMVNAALLYFRQGGDAFTVDAGAPPAGDPDRPLTPQQLAERVVTVSGAWDHPDELRLTLAIRAGYHLNAHDVGRPAEDVPLIPTRLVVEGERSAATITYPRGTERRFTFAGKPLRVYEGEVNVVIRFATPPGRGLHLTLTFQACDDAACLPPVTKRIEAPPH